MPDLRTFRNRLKLRQEGARRIALLDLQRVAPEQRGEAAKILIDHLPNETDPETWVKAVQILGEWKVIAARPLIEQFLNEETPGIAEAARAALEAIGHE